MQRKIVSTTATMITIEHWPVLDCSVVLGSVITQQAPCHVLFARCSLAVTNGDESACVATTDRPPGELAAELLEHRSGGAFVLYRQGDVLLVVFPKMPERAPRQLHCTLARGEMTGHSHRIPVGAIYFGDRSDWAFVQVTGSHADLVHEEHATIRLPGPAFYRVILQREFDETMDAAVLVED